MRTADRAVGIFVQLQRAELHGERIDEQEATGEALADAQDQLDDFGGLDDADQTRENSEDSTLRAGGNKARRWRLRVEAAVAGRVLGGEDAGLPLEAEDGAVDVGLAGEDAGVVDQIAGLEVVRAVGDDVVVAEDFEGVGAGQHGVVLDHVQVGVQRLEHDFGGIDLELADGGGRVNDLALQVAGVHRVEVDQTDGAYARGCKIECERRAESTGAYAEDFGGL